MAQSGSVPPTPNPAAAGTRAGVPSVTTAAGAPWWAPLSQQLTSTRQHLAQLGADLQLASRNWKAPEFAKGLGVRLDVDLLSPAVSKVKQEYAALPEPVRDVMPFAGVAAVTSFAVSRLYDHQLHQVQQRYGLLHDDHEELQARAAQLEAQLQDTDARSAHARLEIQMAEAVAKATTAAAAAATAAASAATAAAAAAPAAAQVKDGSRWS